MAAADKKAQNIIIKRIAAGHAAGHGGAWKVAFADFMTALMCFFLVMWLLGADEETKAAIAAYFNNPNSYKSGDSNSVASPGRNVGETAEVLQGAQGLFPDDIITNPMPTPDGMKTNQELLEITQDIFEGQVYAADINVEFLKFSIPTHLLFQSGSTSLKDDATRYLTKLGKLFQGYSGKIQIQTHTSSAQIGSTHRSNAFEFSLARSVSVMDYFVKSKTVKEDRMMPTGVGDREAYTKVPGQEQKNDRVEFTLTFEK